MATLTLTATPDLTTTPPSVRLQVTDSGAPAITSVVLYRLDPDGRTRKVRTADDGPLPLSGAPATIYDYEPPYGSTLTYSTDQAGGPKVDVTVDVAEPWLTHPGVPSQSVPLDLRAGSHDTEEWAIEQGVFAVLGRSTPIVVTGGARTAPASALVAHTETLAQLSRLGVLLSDGSPLLLNVPPSLGLGIDTSYIAVAGVRVTRTSDVGTSQLRDVEIPYQVVDRPAGGTQAAITWSDVAAQYATWADVAAAVDSWADLANPTG